MMWASDDRRKPHVALLPSAGMGHLSPFLRLAPALVAHNCDVTFVNFRPTVSSAESDQISSLLSALPQIHPLEFHLPQFVDAAAAPVDPFYRHCEVIRSSASLLTPLLSNCSLSSLIIDISLASVFIPIAAHLRLPSYILFTSSAAMLSLFAYLPRFITTNGSTNCTDYIRIPGMAPFPKSSIPPALHDPANLFRAQFIRNGRAVVEANGILVNTFEWLEREALAALNSGMVIDGLAPVTAVGPLPPPPPTPDSKRAAYPPWLDAQPERSVVYVSFGSRTALSRRQIKELGIGLEKSGCRFLWVVKSKIVDREEEGSLEGLFGDGFPERVKGRGVVVKDWVEQNEILAHPAIGGFISHCGWNSVVEAAAHGVRVLAWPRGADQRVNGGIVERSGLGIWERRWSWEAEEVAGEVVEGEEIGERVRELMGGGGAARVREEAAMAIGVGGSSEKGLVGLIEKWGAGLSTLNTFHEIGYRGSTCPRYDKF